MKSIEFLYFILIFKRNSLQYFSFSTLNSCFNDAFEQSLSSDQCDEAANIRFSHGYAADLLYWFIYSSELKADQALQICKYNNFTFTALGR
jgi:hypothetical protein